MGFGKFSFLHFVWLLIIAFGIVWVLYIYAHCSDAGKKTADKIIGGALLFLIVVRIVILCILGHMSVYELPLHLCSLSGILCFLYSYTDWDWLGQVLYTLCLPGTISALIFPDWAYYPPVHFITIQSFLFHGGIVLYVLCQLLNKKLIPNIRKLWKVILFLVVSVPPIYVFDLYYNVNYMFVKHPSAGSPLSWLAGFMGVPGYLVGYALLVYVIMLLMHVIYIICNYLRRTKDRQKI